MIATSPCIAYYFCVPPFKATEYGGIENANGINCLVLSVNGATLCWDRDSRKNIAELFNANPENYRQKLNEHGMVIR